MTAITLSHKIRLDPACKQEKYFRMACGVARFTWNWGLSEWKRQFTCGEKPSGLKLKKQFNAIKPMEFPWTYDVTKYASQQPFIFLQSAFRSFFSKQAGYPKFKKKGVHDSFYIGNDHFRLAGKKIRIPKLAWVRIREALRFTGGVVSATVSRIADKWFVSLNLELGQPPLPCESQAGVGVDLGIRKLATLFDGKGVTEVEGPKPLGKLLKKLRRLQRQLEYKAQMRGNHVEPVHRWFPSSRRCSWCCVVIDDLALSDRVFVCRHCGRTMDRDLNAAINLFSFSTVSSTGFEACGEEGSGSGATPGETSLCEAGTEPYADLYTF